MAKRTKYIIGIDEVGRGPLAGPVTVAVVAVPIKLRIQNAELRIKKKFLNPKLVLLRDSKKLSPRQREDWFNFIKKSQKSKVKGQELYFAVAGVSPKVIDKINISGAANLAAKNAFKRLIQNSELRIENCAIYLDGGLYIKNLKPKNYKLKTIVRGDEKISAIALASIVAKVTRDRIMKKLHKKYPKYDFGAHKGYGTKKHFKMIKKYGHSPVHRKSFSIKKAFV